MKHLSMWLTVLLLGGLPLAAAALDYGPNRPLLAAESGAPQLPGAVTRPDPAGASAKPDLAEAGIEATPETSPAALRVAAPAPPATTPSARAHGSTASNKPATPALPRPAAQQDHASWRSLLPGSIQ